MEKTYATMGLESIGGACWAFNIIASVFHIEDQVII
jgi:hypothetical protein